MNKRIYGTIFEINCRAFGYYADELYGAESDYYFFQIIAVYFAPLLRQGTSLESLYFKYIKGKDSYLKEWQEVESRAGLEMEQVFTSLKTDLQSFLGDPNVQIGLNAIEQVFREKNSYRIPSYLDEAYERIQALLQLLLNEEDVVAKYAIVRCRDVVRHNQEMKPEVIRAPYIEEYTFAPSFLRLKELDNIWDYEDIKDFWIACEYLFLVEWCWGNSFSFFADKTENYEGLQSCNNSVRLIILREHWIEINKIKRKQSNNSFLFKRDIYLKLLKLIINEAVFEQAICKGLTEISYEEKESKPYWIKIRFAAITSALMLDVQWHEGEGVHTYIVCQFHERSGPYNFYKAFDAAEVGEKINIDDVSGASGGNIAKCLAGTRMNNILGQLFFTKNDFNKTKTILVKAKEVYSRDLSVEDRNALMKHIKSMKICPMQK